MFAHYAEFIQNHTFDESKAALPAELLIEKSGDIEVYYAPFDHINTDARVVICGITPGRKQAREALKTASQRLRQRDSIEVVSHAAKLSASFKDLRPNLTRLLNSIGMSEKLDIACCSELFEEKSHLVHNTSALRYPVFKSGANYSGTPSMVRNPLLRKQIDTYLIPELSRFDEATIVIPLGAKVENALHYAVQAGALNEDQILAGLPHPSGENGERIAYFLGEKPAEKLSVKTNASIIDAAKSSILAKVAHLKS